MVIKTPMVLPLVTNGSNERLKISLKMVDKGDGERKCLPQNITFLI